MLCEVEEERCSLNDKDACSFRCKFAIMVKHVCID